MHTEWLSHSAVPGGLRLLQTSQDLSRCYILTRRSFQTGATRSKDPSRRKLNCILESAHSDNQTDWVFLRYFVASQYKWLGENIPGTGTSLGLSEAWFAAKIFSRVTVFRIQLANRLLYLYYHQVWPSGSMSVFFCTSLGDLHTQAKSSWWPA